MKNNDWVGNSILYNNKSAHVLIKVSQMFQYLYACDSRTLNEDQEKRTLALPQKHVADLCITPRIRPTWRYTGELQNTWKYDTLLEIVKKRNLIYGLDM